MEWVQVGNEATPVEKLKYAETIEIEVSLKSRKVIDTDELALISSLPKFATTTGENIILEPTKKDHGEYSIVFSDLDSTNLYLFNVIVANSPIDYDSMERELKSYLGSTKKNFGIYIEDLPTSKIFTMNGDKVYPPASLSKLPSVVLALRDIDSGKYKLNTTFLVQNQFKHTTFDAIAVKPEGAPVSLKFLIQQAILVSSNTAHYHLHKVVLGGMTIVVPRTKNELGVQNFFLDPHTSTANSVGKLLSDVYNYKSLSVKSRKLLLDLMRNAILKDGIPAGLPKGVTVANKEGFLFGGKEGSTHSDSAIIFGKHTNYVLVILNNNAPAFPGGTQALKDISSIVYKYMDQE